MVNVPSELAQPHEWITHLGGAVVTPFNMGQRSPVVMGHYRYPGRPLEFLAPSVGSHYLSVTLDGSLSVDRKLDGKQDQGNFQPGTCLLMPARSRNAWRWSAPTEEFLLFIDPDYLGAIARREGLGTGVLNDSFAFVDQTIWHFAKMMQNEARDTSLPGGVWLDSCARVLAIHLLRHYSASCDARPRAGGLTGFQLAKVRSLAEARLHEPLRLEDFSDAAGLSPFHFARQFKKETGKTLYRWLVDLRIEQARLLLTETTLPVIEIAARVGFQSQSRFGAVFKQRTGLTPMAFRNRSFCS